MGVNLARDIALKTLYNINEEGAYANISIDKYLEAYELKDIDRAFVTELVYGAVKWKLTIDWIIEQFSSVRLKKISPWILNILRLGIYQLIYTDRIPESAACNESVSLAKKYGHTASSGYVNAVLRNIARSRGTISYPDKNKGYSRFLSIRHSHPEWMVKGWLERFGSDFTESLLASNNEAPDFSVRVNTLKVTRERLLENFRESGIEAGFGKYVEEALIIKSPLSVARLDSFKNGCFQVQDESSMLAARILDPKPGELVMDVCSAPGGKATHIAQLMADKGIVVARDIYEHKIRIMNETIKRLGLNIIRTEIFDAALIDENYVDRAERVIVDAPCTGFGIIRRKPDIKWARNAEDKNEIIKLQYKILNAASKYVMPGGTLVYSTCTIEKEENEDIIMKFLNSNDGFKPVDISQLFPAGLKIRTAGDGYIQLFPNMHGTDGFFIARMERRR